MAYAHSKLTDKKLSLRGAILSYDNSHIQHLVRSFLPQRVRTWVGKRISKTFVESQIRERVDDATVLLADFPRCGNTWLRYMFASVLHAAQTGKIEKLNESEFYTYCPTLLGREPFSPYTFNGTRLLKTHEIFRAEFVRGIITYRDPYAALRSLRALELAATPDFQKAMADYSADKDTFINWIDYYLDFNSSWLNAKLSRPKEYFLVDYDLMVRSTADVLRAMCDFLNILEITLPPDAIDSVAAMYSKADVSRKSQGDIDRRRTADKVLGELYCSTALKEIDPVRFDRIKKLEHELRYASFETFRDKP